MYKKALSLLLALMLIVTSLSVAVISVAASGSDASGLTVTADSNFFPTETQSFTQDQLDSNGEMVTVTYSIQSEENLLNTDWLLTYDGTVLQFDEEANTTGEGRNAKLDVMPSVSDEIVNTNPTSVEYGLRGNCTSLSSYPLNDGEGGKVAFVSVAFKVIGSGDTTVHLQVIDLRMTKIQDGQTVSQPEDETQVVNDGTVVDSSVAYSTSTEVTVGEEAPEETTAPVEETTEAQEETTEAVEETTEAVEETTTPAEEDDTLIVAGSEPEIFGTSWDGTNTDNLMTKQADGTYTKDYTVSKAYDAVQLKAVKNGSEWIGDKTDNNVTFNVTAPGTFTVTYHPAEGEEPAYVDVTGDNVEAITTFDYDTVYAVGNGEGTWLNGASWDPAYAGNEMTKVADDLWEISFDNVPDGFERQIKFAIDGAWTHNFGGAFEASGVETVADYNGDNITFDTDDVCTVKAQLDLREFDFTTKEGAKFTITITYDDVEETTAEVEETTSDVEETTAAVEETTVAEETQPATEPAPAASLVVKATSNLFPETVNAYDDLSAYEDDNHDVFVTVEYKLAAPGQYLINLDVEELSWDPAVLEFKEAYNIMGSGRQAKFTIFPFAFEQGLGAGMVNTFGDNNGGRLVGNYTSVQPAAYATEEDNVSPVTVVRAVFKVLDREAGVTTVNLLMDTLSLCDDSVAEPYSQNVLVSGGVVDEDILENCTVQTIIQPEGQVEPPVEETTTPEETTEAVEETTEAQEETTEAQDTTVAEETTEAQEETTLADVTTTPVGETLTVDGTSNYCPSVPVQVVNVNDTVTVSFKAPEDADIVDIQWGMNYDKDLLQLTGLSTFDGGPMLINTSAESFNVLGSLSDINNPYHVNAGDDFITFVFEAKAPGTTTVDLRIIDMTVREDNEDKIIFVNEEDKRQEEPEVTTAPVEETTEAVEETTEAQEETTEAVEETTTPVAEDDTLVVAGSEPEIFGTSWDATNEDNLMTKQGDGTYTKEYTVDKAYDAVQLKGVKNGTAWIGDKTGNNVTFNLTGPGTFTVTYHPAAGEEPEYVEVTGTNVEAITTFEYSTVYAVGNGEGTWLNGVAWEPGNAANEMSEVADDVWEITFENVPDGFERQIKFAIDGAWTHNFGGAFSESGVETDAVYNGDNITFDTDDVCTVKAQLDLRDFDFVTKEGAKFTITITYNEEEETTEAVEETTEAVEETTEAVEETTEAVEETTEAVEETTGAVEETTTPEEETTAPEEGTTTAEDETTTPVEEGSTNPDETAGTSSTDATSATRSSSTSDSSSTPDSGNGSSNGGFVQTGNASMAIIILLVLVSATAGIWFARKKVK